MILFLAFINTFATVVIDHRGMCSQAFCSDDVPDVLRLLESRDFKSALVNLVDHGDKLFPYYESIFRDATCSDRVRCRLYIVLQTAKGDRSGFLKNAIADLIHKNGDVRSRAIECLSHIGSDKDAAPIVALLSDGHTMESASVPYVAATALTAIGGLRELVAFDAWLIGGSHADNKYLRAHVKKCRDELAARLAKEKATKK